MSTSSPGKVRSARAHGIVSLTCRVCERVFVGDASRSGVRSNYRRHLLVHSGERPFLCVHCGTGFTTRHNMRRHIRSHHPDFASPERPVTEGTSAKLTSLSASTMHKLPASCAQVEQDDLQDQQHQEKVAVAATEEIGRCASVAGFDESVSPASPALPLSSSSSSLSAASLVCSGELCNDSSRGVEVHEQCVTLHTADDGMVRMHDGARAAECEQCAQDAPECNFYDDGSRCTSANNANDKSDAATRCASRRARWPCRFCRRGFMWEATRALHEGHCQHSVHQSAHTKQREEQKRQPPPEHQQREGQNRKLQPKESEKHTLWHTSNGLDKNCVIAHRNDSDASVDVADTLSVTNDAPDQSASCRSTDRCHAASREDEDDNRHTNSINALSQESGDTSLPDITNNEESRKDEVRYNCCQHSTFMLRRKVFVCENCEVEVSSGAKLRRHVRYYCPFRDDVFADPLHDAAVHEKTRVHSRSSCPDAKPMLGQLGAFGTSKGRSLWCSSSSSSSSGGRSDDDDGDSEAVCCCTDEDDEDAASSTEDDTVKENRSSRQQRHHTVAMPSSYAGCLTSSAALHASCYAHHITRDTHDVVRQDDEDKDTDNDTWQEEGYNLDFTRRHSSHRRQRRILRKRLRAQERRTQCEDTHAVSVRRTKRDEYAAKPRIHTEVIDPKGPLLQKLRHRKRVKEGQTSRHGEECRNGAVTEPSACSIVSGQSHSLPPVIRSCSELLQASAEVWLQLGRCKRQEQRCKRMNRRTVPSARQDMECHLGGASSMRHQCDVAIGASDSCVPQSWQAKRRQQQQYVCPFDSCLQCFRTRRLWLMHVARRHPGELNDMITPVSTSL